MSIVHGDDHDRYAHVELFVPGVGAFALQVAQYGYMLETGRIAPPAGTIRLATRSDRPRKDSTPRSERSSDVEDRGGSTWTVLQLDLAMKSAHAGRGAEEFATYIPAGKQHDLPSPAAPHRHR